MSRFIFSDLFNKSITTKKDKIGIYTWSDIHSEHEINFNIIKNLSKSNIFQKEKDILILAGDICYNIRQFETTLKLFKLMFDKIFLVLGNSEFRVDYEIEKRRFSNSIEKYEEVKMICEKNNIFITPKKFYNIWFIPLLSWYTPYFDKSYNGDTSYQDNWLDFDTIIFPKEIAKDPNKYFNSINKMNFPQSLKLNNKEKYEGDLYHPGHKTKIITFSHFLPRRDLLPSNIFLKNSLSYIMGNNELEKTIRNIQPNPIIHVFGHSHINCDVTLKGIRYVQNSLSHPVERKWKYKSVEYPKLIYEIDEKVIYNL